MSTRVFLSIGNPATPAQAAFKQAILGELLSLGLEPITPGQNYAANAQPLKAIERCMRDCDGVIVVAYERFRIQHGLEKPDSQYELKLSEVRWPTVWNHIEGAVAAALDLPLVVIAEAGLQEYALLENRYNWTVQWVPLDPTILKRLEMTQVLSDWRGQVEDHKLRRVEASTTRPDEVQEADLERESIATILGRLKVRQAWGAGAALIALLGGVFQLGRQTTGTSEGDAPSGRRSEILFVSDVRPERILGGAAQISARAISMKGDSALLILTMPNSWPDTFALRQGDFHSFYLGQAKHAISLRDIRGGDGKPGGVELGVVRVNPE